MIEYALNKVQEREWSVLEARMWLLFHGVWATPAIIAELEEIAAQPLILI